MYEHEILFRDNQKLVYYCYNKLPNIVIVDSDFSLSYNNIINKEITKNEIHYH